VTKEQTFEHPPRGHVALLAYDSVNDRFQVVHIDANGLLQVDVAAQAANLDVNIAAQAIDVEVTQATPADLVVAAHGYDGAAWRKQPLIWGYTDRIVEAVVVADATVGTNYLALGVVPAGEVWVIEAMSGTDDTTVPTGVLFGAYNGSAWLWMKQVAAPVVSVYADYQGVLRLKAGDNCAVVFLGCTLNDNLYANFVGYKMSITM